MLVVASDEAGARTACLEAAARIESQPESSFSTQTGAYFGVGPSSGSVALLFSGQGSQYVSMGADLAIAFPAARKVWDALAAL